MANNLMKSIFWIILICITAISCNTTANNPKEPHTVGNFKAILIGDQEWMAENLNVANYSNGDSIPQARSKQDWLKYSSEKKGCWCYYSFDASNEKVYGKLYNWYAVNDNRGLAPTGWHIPADTEWSIILKYLGGDSVAAKKMKSTIGWKSYGNGNNGSGFAALPAGFLCTDGVFYYIGVTGHWWSSTPYGSNYAWVRTMLWNFSIVERISRSRQECMSVRCIKNK
jgi:uncharacterized protein (TIGR02145 family)